MHHRQASHHLKRCVLLHLVPLYCFQIQSLQLQLTSFQCPNLHPSVPNCQRHHRCRRPNLPS
ncbi:hypothetical protein DL95DRAFT_379658, partial [Leptodontidium sp. 2 PMI_412]